MSNKAIIIAVLLAVGLLGLIVYSNWRSGTPGSGSSLTGDRDAVALPINAADVVGIKIKGGAGAGEDAVRRDASGAWAFVLASAVTAAPAPAPGATPAPQPEPITWPADPTPIQNFARALSELAPDPKAPRAGKMPDANALVTLTMKDGSARMVRIGTAPVGGKTVVDIDGKAPFMADASILAMATQPGPKGWRINRALPGASASELSRVSVSSNNESLAFSRQENRWFISRPVSARASAAGVGAMLDALGRITIEKFADEGGTPGAPGVKLDATSTGIASPRMIITTEKDVRSLDASGTVRTEVKRRDLFVGGPADGSGTRLYASSDASGTPLFLIDSSSITAVSTAARTYLDLTASSASPADVGLITLKAGKQETGYRRINGKWHKLLPGGKTDKAEVDPKAVAEMVDFLTTRQGQPELVKADAAPVPAPAPAPGTAPGPGGKPSAKPAVASTPKPVEPVSTLSRVSLMTDDGTEIDTLTMGYTPEGTLAARSRDVVVTYTGAAAPKLLAIPEFKPAAGQPSKKKAKTPSAPSKK
jgi:hypothetical protein